MNGRRRSRRQARIDICVCTFRGRELEPTLRSLGELVLPPDATVRIIVADNDTQPERARRWSRRCARSCRSRSVYVHCPAGNISIARNACLDSSSRRFSRVHRR